MYGHIIKIILSIMHGCIDMHGYDNSKYNAKYRIDHVTDDN